MSNKNAEKRVVILTADAGFGHRAAANAIAAAMDDLFAGRCAVEILNPLDDNRVPAFLRDTQADQDRMVREMPELYKFGYEASDAAFPSVMVETGLILMLFEVMNDLVERYQPHVVVTTYPLYQAPVDAVKVIMRKKAPLVTVITDLATVHRLWFNENADACLVPTPVVRELAIKNGLLPERVLQTGLPIHPRLALEKRSKSELRKMLGWREDLPVVLAVGSRRVRKLEAILRVFNHSGIPMQLVVVAGGDVELYDRLCAVEWHLPIHVYNFVDNMGELLHAADCIVTKAGGLIVTEALACGLPMLLIDVNPGQEVGNADYVSGGQAGALADNPLDALEILYHWMMEDGKELQQAAAHARALGNPRAAYTVAEKVWEFAQLDLQQPADRNIFRSIERSKLIETLRENGIRLFSKE